jgi:hypothetical protein
VDPLESLEELEAYRVQQGHPWPVAFPASSLIVDLRITVQSTKVAIDHNGVITYRDGYGRGDEEVWRQVMEALVEKAAE